MNKDLLRFVTTDDEYELRELATAVQRFSSELHADEYHEQDFRKMGELGLTGMSVGEDVGGSPLPALHQAAVIYEVARAALGPAIYLGVHSMVGKLLYQWRGDSSLFGEELAALAGGKKLGAFCLTEASAGSDASSLKTSAKQDGDDWVLSGEKIYVTSGPVADLFLVFARTGDQISAFVLPGTSEGLERGPAEKKMGCEAAPISSITFNNVRLPKSKLLGELGAGYKTALSGLNGGRISIAAAACGVAAHAIEIATAFANERAQFGSRITEFQGIRFMIADLVTQLRAAIELTRAAALAVEKNPASNASASIAKLFATDAAMKITTDCVQLMGGAGYLGDYGAEQLMRDAKMLQIVEGTNQIQRVVIAREFLKE